MRSLSSAVRSLSSTPNLGRGWPLISLTVRACHPILLRNRAGARLTPASAAARLNKLGKQAGLQHSVSPHSLRRTFCTAGLVSGVPLRDMQYAMRHADARTTLRYDMARANLDRHAAHAVAAYLAGMSIG